MNLRCRINWHRWGLWQSVPITSNPFHKTSMGMRKAADELRTALNADLGIPKES